MGWKQYTPRTKQAARLPRRARGTVRELRRLDPNIEPADDLLRYERYLERLVRVHTDCHDTRDWRRLPMTAPPPEPAYSAELETAARARLALFRPGFADQLTGRANRKRAELQDRIAQAMYADRKRYESALAEHRAQYRRWIATVRLAPDVLRLDEAACRDALRFVGAFEDLAAFGSHVELESITDGVATITCVLADPDLVPHEELVIGADGKVGTKDMAITKYWSLYREHVCSCALRIAREAFAALPVQHVCVNVLMERVEPRTIYSDSILALRIARAALADLVFETLDPVATVQRFPHRMQFQATLGFQPVTSLVVDALTS